MSILCDRLREERRRLRLSQEELGALGGVTKGAQLNYESGERSPTAAYLEAVAGHGVDVTYVLTGNRVAVGVISDDEARLLERFRAGSPALAGYLQELRAITQRSPAASQVQIGGDVGQMVAGDASFAAPMSFSLGSKKKKS